VVLLPPICAESAEERCDALDSDCDGAIDEGCDGATEGAVNVAVAWNGGADLDLEASGPRPLSRVASRADCAEHQARIERAGSDDLVAGHYRIALHHADACGTEGPVTASVSVSVANRVLGIYNRSLQPGERADIVRFDLR
jgi:hypothetical protein